MPGLAHVAPARRLVQGGRLRRSLLRVEQGVASPVVAGGAVVRKLYSLQLPQGRPPRAAAAHEKGTRAQTGTRSRGPGRTELQPRQPPLRRLLAERGRRARTVACPSSTRPPFFSSR